MKSGHDINKIHGDGYLVIPLSMARLSAGQSPEEVYDIVDYFAEKLHTYSNDVVFLYTGGLYFNSEDISHEKRVKLNNQAVNHALALRKLIQQKKQYMPRAFHFLPIDYVILNSADFRLFFNTLKKAEAENEAFQEAIKQDIGDREYTEANVNFILEEVAVAHIIRQRLVEFPRTLVKEDTWRLLVYPGERIAADEYQCKNGILPQPDAKNPFNKGQYDFTKKEMVVYE